MAGSAQELTPLAPDDSRRLARTHLFVAATLSFAGGSAPVHVRNMSPSGALIEGAVLPGQGEPATLRRGSLEAIVKIVWTSDRKAGVSFVSAVHVASWMSRTVPSHQAQVDNILHQIRSGRGPEGSGEAMDAPGQVEPAIEAELRELRLELARLEHALGHDEAVIMAHPEVQLFDIALQRIDRMIARVRGATRK